MAEWDEEADFADAFSITMQATATALSHCLSENAMSPRLALSSGSYRRAPSAHRRGAEAPVRLSSCEVALDVKVFWAAA
jgi:hypothetical protein